MGDQQMPEVTVSQFASVVGIPVERLQEQIEESGLPKKSADEMITDEEEKEPKSDQLTLGEDRLSIFEDYLGKSIEQDNSEENSADKDEPENTGG